MIVLIGFMGAGKTTVGRLLAEQVGLPFVDTDAVIEQRAAAPIAAIFEQAGENAFRELERDVVAEVLGGPDAVVALGGGALSDPATCAALEWARVVHLDVSFTTAMQRVGDDRARPMLGLRDPKELYDERLATYRRIARAAVATDERAPEEVVADILGALDLAGDSTLGGLGRTAEQKASRVRVLLGERSYDVVIGAGVAGSLGTLLPPGEARERAFVITHSSLERHAEVVAGSLAEAGLKPQIEAVPEGEAAKSIAAAESLYSRMAAIPMHGSDLVVSVGGGVVCDLAGFVASTYNRGLEVVHVPTSLLAQVDAAIGGKTAVNLEAGKNLVGTIHQPVVVVCDVELLGTLPDEEIRSGLAEVIKHGFIADPYLLELVRSRAADILERDIDILREVVARSVAIKAGIVSGDERETQTRGGLGRTAEQGRAVLNYGHTFGHAIEHLTGMRHGEAIALGMMCAAYLAEELGRVGDEVVDLHRRVLGAAGLPSAAELELDALERVWLLDKKYRGGLRFVLLAGVGKAEAGITVERGAIGKALSRMSKRGGLGRTAEQ